MNVISTKKQEDTSLFGPGYTYVLLLLFRAIGIPVSVNQPLDALQNGATGYAIVYFIVYVFIGIPIVYMELIIGQFTSRDCIEVWNIRKCVSHIGYFLYAWQVILYMFNHLAITFTNHFFFVSFETPAPFYLCDWWSNPDCDILTRNYSLYKNCLKNKHRDEIEHCKNIFSTLPSYQYFRNYILGSPNYLGISWPLTLASGILCMMLFVNSFKRLESIKVFIYPLTLYPLIGFIILMIGGLRQKGIISNFADAIDITFTTFIKDYQLTHIVTQVLFSLGVGNGVFISLSANASFRLSCFNNAVVTVLIAAAFNLLTIFTSATFVCPFSITYGISPREPLAWPMSFLFEFIPWMLSEFQRKSFFLVLIFSCHTVIGFTTALVLLFTLNDVMMKQFPNLAQYPVTCCLGWVLATYILTIPLLGKFGYSFVMQTFSYVNSISMFFVLLECFVFIIWYGTDRLYQDVHFMLGTPPKNFVKVCWLLATIVITIVFFLDITRLLQTYKTTVDKVRIWTLIFFLALPLLIVLIRLVVAAFKKQFREITKIDSTWGPKSNLLLRSRAMFTSHAMTKEYIYRKYHLQANIAARQIRSNIRAQPQVY